MPGLGRPWRTWTALSQFFILGLLGCVSAETPGFLIISAPRNNKISWIPLPENGDFSGLRPTTLIDEGLDHPQGIAVDQKRKRLYVADPDVKKVFSYQLEVQGGQLRTDGVQTVVAENRESRWVAVDGVGNVFFSDEPENLILKVPAAHALRGGSAAEVVYDGAALSEVNEPGGIAVDNFHLYWTNKHLGTEVGTLVRGFEAPAAADPATTVSALAKNAVKSYGVCLALGNIYFTDSEQYLYGVKKTGGEVAEVSRQLHSPRGCAFDGDGTVYVADRDANIVYSFAGNMPTLGHAELKQAFHYEDAFGLATVMSAAHRFSCSALALPVLLASLTALWA